MEALIYAILILGAFVAAVFVFGTADEELEKRTGRNFKEWLGWIWGISLFSGLSAVGLWIVFIGAERNSVIIILPGLIICLFFGVMAYKVYRNPDDF